jgi:predicted CopG family antitoxin
VDKTIKVDEATYRMLNELVGKIRSEEKRPVSINEALSKILKEKKKGNIMDFAGSWEMSDKEADEIKRDIKRHRRSWTIRY